MKYEWKEKENENYTIFPPFPQNGLKLTEQAYEVLDEYNSCY